MKTISKKRRKELHKIYEEKLRKEFVIGLEQQPMCSSYEWTNLMMAHRPNEKSNEN